MPRQPDCSGAGRRSSPRRRLGRVRRPQVLDVGDDDPEALDGADDLALDIAVAIQLGRGNEEDRIRSFLPEIPFELRKCDRFLERQAFAAHGDRVDVRR